MTAPTILHGLDGLRSAAGLHLGHSDWLTIDRDRIALFARATGAIRDGAEVGLGEAPAMLTLSLSNYFLPQVVEVAGVSHGVNYGVNAVRFDAPVPAGARVRCGVEFVSAHDVANGVETVMRLTIEVEGVAEPACVIDAVSRFYA